MRDEDIVPAELAEDQHEAILTSQILPAWTRDAVPQDHPVVVIVAGPAGSGKSALCDLLLEVLGRRGGAVLIGRDLYKKAHPLYDTLMRANDRTAGVRVRPDVLRWQAAVEAYARSRRFDVVLEEPVAEVDEACAKARVYRADGYRVELVALAVAEAEAQLSGLDRTWIRSTSRVWAGPCPGATWSSARATCPCSFRPSRPNVSRTRSWWSAVAFASCTATNSLRTEPPGARRRVLARRCRRSGAGRGPRRRPGSSGAVWPARSSAYARPSSPRSVAWRSPEGWSAPSRWPSRCEGRLSRSLCRPGSTTTACLPASTGGSSTS
ncbi:zeta toxin family protein [Streptomyces virginiae]|uniref:zeta toxin family protein n=1 Tax=Streptomyces virginiae TaxID=1961 RepID=UPI00369EFAA6